MSFFKRVRQAQLSSNIREKKESITSLLEEFDTFDFHSNTSIDSFSTPSYLPLCKVVAPKNVPRRKGFDTIEKQSFLVHAITHIEYTAIDLALDSAYRFRGMPKEFYYDFLEVADDEVRHFEMLQSLLNELGYAYGDVPVHASLWESGEKTPDLLSRMAVVPRWQEANGLDANESIITRLESYCHPFAEKIIQALRIILKEEIPHVQKGDKWFKYECERLGHDQSIYFDIIERVFPQTKKKKYLNKEARLEAGFSCKELNQMSEGEVC